MLSKKYSLMSKLADECFNECVHQFPSRILSKDETKCIEHCADRFIALSQRVGQEYQKVQHKRVLEEKLRQMELNKK